jgi:GTP-binding protein HflX
MGQGIDQFVDALQSALSAWRLRSHFRIPLSESNLIAELHRVGHVLELRYDNDYAVITAHVPPHLEQKLTGFIAR